MLIPFAGNDPEEPAIEVSEPKYLRRKSHSRPLRAYRMFLGGSDTLYISQRLKYSELTILRWITAERCKRRGLPSPYGHKP